MKKYLMTVMAAVTLGGLFTGCSNDADLSGGNTAEFNIVQNYEKAFVTRFGEPAATQTWGFGSASAGTRAVVPQPSVSKIGYSFNATMTMAANAASAAGESAGSYSSWAASGWADEVYQVNGTVEASNISGKLKTAIVNKILGPDGIPENVNNLSKATELGYSVVTTERGPVTLTPVYHQSSSGDPIYYYYYPKGTNPDVKKLPKYSIGYMADPNVCKENISALNENTYSLVYVDGNNVSYDFPKDMVINFIVSNVDYKYPSTVDIYEPGSTTLTSQGKFAVSADEYYPCGSDRYIDGKVQIRLGNQLGAPQFTQAKQGSSFTFQDTNFNWYLEGNGVNGNLNGGSTCYYFRPEKSGTIHVGVKLNSGKKLYIQKLGSEYDPSSYYEGTSLTGFDGKTVTEDYTGVYSFDVEAWNWYAVYAEGSKLGFYGFVFECKDWQGNVTSTEKNGVFTSALGPFDCGFGIKLGSVNVKLGKTPYFSKPKSDGSVSGYTAYTSGTSKNGGLSGMATTYYFLAWNPGVIRVAVSLNENKRFYIKDLGINGWNNTSGTSLSGYDGITVSSKYNGTFDFPVEPNHVYAVYAEESKLGFYGCEFFTKSSSAGGKKTIGNHPEFYGDGNYNTSVHFCCFGWTVNPSTTSHAAVFNTELTDEDGKKVKVSLIGFEDWTDLDFNDVIFAVTGAEPEIEQPPVIIEVPDDPEGFVCRIIAEDLTVGENSDFDFNDVVFDVYWSGGVTTIRLLAAGGELPLYIGSVDDAHEVHKLFGFPNSYPLINTNWKNGKTANPVEFTISGTYSNRAACKNIPIYVTKKGENIQLKADQGKVASMVAVGLDYEWCDEREDIDSKFRSKNGTKLFRQYVIGKLGDDWDNNKAWYQYKGKDLPNN